MKLIMDDAQFDVDLQAKEISPTKPTLKVGEFTEVTVAMGSNGPDAIPVSEATFQITLSSVYLGKPSKIKNIGKGKEWDHRGTITTLGIHGHHNMFFQNNKGPMPVDHLVGNSGVVFTVKAKKATKQGVQTSLRLASSLSATAMSGDVDGANQSVSADMTVLPKATP